MRRYTLGSFTLSPLTDRFGAWTSIIGGLAGIGVVQFVLAFAPISDAWALALAYGAPDRRRIALPWLSAGPPLAAPRAPLDWWAAMQWSSYPPP